jgi:sulfate adenylyltransferase large subunit
MSHDVAAHLAHQARLSLLRFSTAGSVDDGKSTLIGRLLFDAKGIFEDQLAHVEEASRRRGFDRTELALLTDGLRAEREQGITIDVAYRYFATPKRKFIIADTPGHVQYTRNMVTGASTADVAIVLVDARHGVVEQSRRHATLSRLLGIEQLVLAVNKMDLVDWSEQRFNEIAAQFQELCVTIGARDVLAIPLSALHGDNVVSKSDKTPWYAGPALLEHLETVQLKAPHRTAHPRFAVQWVIRPQTDTHHDYRGYAGQIASGVFREGDEIIVLPTGHRTRISTIDLHGTRLAKALAPLSVSIQLRDNLDISRGDLFALVDDQPTVTQEFKATVCWMSERPLSARAMVAIKQNTRWARAMITSIDSKLDVNTMQQVEASGQKLLLNDLGKITVKTTIPMCVDPYEMNRTTGSFILVDEATNATLGAAMIDAAL